MSPKIIIGIIVTVVILIGLSVFLSRPTTKVGNLDEFAKCLKEKSVIMYGAYWCSHCQAQKKLFGSSFQYVSYVECTVESKTCTEKGITGYPTWIMGDTRLEGEQTLQKLSEISSCQLP